MSEGRVHVIGAGVAGLSVAVRASASGRPVTVWEAAGHAGGRCRSFDDSVLGRRIDNGNHLVLSGNQDVAAYLDLIGARDALIGPAVAEFPFVDLKSGERWAVRPGPGRVPWWVLSAKRRIPGTRAIDYLPALRLAFAGGNDTVATCLGRDGILVERFWEPLTVAVLNAGLKEGAAPLLWTVMRETFGRGEAACRPLLARHGLGDAFVEPALRCLEHAGAEVMLGRRIRELVLDGDRLVALVVAGGERLPVHPGDVAVLAVPPAAADVLVPGLTVPIGSRAIVNGHFLLAEPRAEPSMIGLVGGLCQWVFVRGDVASTTVSAADGLIDTDAADIAGRMWSEVCQALGCPRGPLPQCRIVKEKRATFAQVPANLSRRPPPKTRWSNLFLAGDWTDTGLPATIEGSLRSGRIAFEIIVAAS